MQSNFIDVAFLNTVATQEGKKTPSKQEVTSHVTRLTLLILPLVARGLNCAWNYFGLGIFIYRK